MEFEELRDLALILIQNQIEPDMEIATDIQTLIRELKIQHTELIIQNEELKRAQQELSGLQQKYETLYELAPCGYITLNSRGMISNANAAALRLLRTSRDLILHSSLSFFIGPEYQERFLDARKKAVETGVKQTFVFERSTGPGQETWIRGDIEAEKGEDNALIQWRVVLMDITEQYLNNQELQKKHEVEKKVTHEKLDFMMTLSHEIFTPLNAVIGASESFSGNVTDNYQAACLKRVENSGKLLSGFINDILLLWNAESGKLDIRKHNVDFRRLLKDILRTYSEKAGEKGLALSFAVAGDLPESIWVDDVRIRQALIKLVDNAIAFTSKGGVFIRVWSDHFQPGSFFCDLHVAVEDTGGGIPERDLELIFHAFHRESRARNDLKAGRGLGLSIARKLVEAMGGNLSVTSRVGKGSCFTMVLEKVRVNASDAIRNTDDRDVVFGDVESTGSSIQVLSERDVSFKPDKDRVSYCTDDRTMPDGLKEIILRDINPVLKTFMNGLLIGEVRELASRLEMLGREYDFPALEKAGSQLMVETMLYDIEGIHWQLDAIRSLFVEHVPETSRSCPYDAESETQKGSR